MVISQWQVIRVYLPSALWWQSRRADVAVAVAVAMRRCALMLSALGAAAALGIGVPTRPVGARACVSMRDRSLEGASSVLGRLAAEAFKRAQSGDASQPIKTKSFTFRTKVTHTRDILGAELVEYMSLPVESFALYDAELMRRIDADTFELRLPVRGSANGLDLMQPKLVVRVTPSPETSSLLISSIRASLFGEAQARPEPGRGSEPNPNPQP